MKNVLSFLKKIKKNNNREWMHAHKDEYLTAKGEFDFLVEEIITRIRAWDPRLPYMEPKNCTFRINRDTRFSENKSPYKENFGAFFAYGGKKAGLPGYYLHISPKEIFVAGGEWMPEPEQLVKIRRHIIKHGKDLEKILNNKTFKKNFSGLDTDHVLQRPPKGFFPDDPYVEFLKFKSFTVSHELDVKDVLSPGFGKLVDSKFKLIKPLNEFLYEAIHRDL